MISIKLAKEISLLKWEGELNDINNKKIIEALYPNAHEYFYCGFCIRHNYSNYPSDITKCLNCEIAASPAKSCLNDDSLYNKIENLDCYEEEIDLKNEAIKEMIEIIKNIPEEDE
jgi:hypothetical protein